MQPQQIQENQLEIPLDQGFAIGLLPVIFAEQMDKQIPNIPIIPGSENHIVIVGGAARRKDTQHEL